MSITGQGRRLLSALADVLITTSGELFEVGDAIAAAVLGPLAAVSSVNLYDEITGRVELIGASAADGARVEPYRRYLREVEPDARLRLHEQILESGQPVAFDLSDPETALPADRPAFLREEVVHHMVVPLVADGTVFGTLQVGREEPYGEGEAELVVEAGRIAGPAVANAVRMRGLRRTERITRVMSGNVGLEQLFAAVLPELRTVLGVDTVRLLVVETGRDRLMPAFALGAAFDEGDRIPFGAGFAGQIASDRVAIVVEDAKRFPIQSAGLRGTGLASLAGVPIMDEDVLGVLHVGTWRPRRFKAEDLELLALVADRLALALRQSAVEAALRRSQAISQSVLDTAADAILTYDADGGIRMANRSVERLFGWRPEQLVGRSLTELVPEASGAVLAPAPDRLPHDTIAVEAVRHDGSRVAADLTVSEVETTADGRLFTAILRDASARRASEARLRHEALHDVLTGLPNRALFLEHLERSLARHDREERQVAVMFLDLDRFKQVNDTLGHAAGDELLRQAARRLGLAVRPTDVLARLGGDEFAVLLEGLMPVDATVVAQRILSRFDSPFSLEGQTLRVGTSIGIAHTLANPQTPEELLRAADVALYRAKGAGRGRFDVFDDGMRAWLEGRLTLQAELRDGLERGEITVHYEPVIDLRGGEARRLEAVPLWNHPRRGPLAADEFVEVAEEMGVIGRLELEVVRQVAARLARWEATREDEIPHVCIHLSTAQLTGGLEPLLKAADARLGSLAFEVSETVLMQDGDRVAERLRELRDHGATIVLNGFGGAYSSAAQLRRLPVDVVKIDPGLIAGIARSEDDHAVVHGLIDLAHALGMLVVGEGVEHGAQLEILKALSCDLAQGSLLREGPEPGDARATGRGANDRARIVVRRGE